MVTELRVDIFGDYNGRFGYMIRAHKGRESGYKPSRGYKLACVSKLFSVKDKIIFPVWFEIINSRNKVIYSSEPLKIFDSADNAGSMCYFFAKGDLGDWLGEHLEKKESLQQKIRRLEKREY